MERNVYRYKSRSKAARKSKGGAGRFLRRLSILLATIYLAWALFLPEIAGSWGAWAQGVLVGFFGFSAYLIPLFLLNALFWSIKAKKSAPIIIALGTLACLLSASAVLSMAGNWLSQPDWGGSSGMFLEGGVSGLIGKFGTLLLFAAIGLLALQIPLGVRWSRFVSWSLNILVEDFKSWKQARHDLSLQLSRAPAPAIPAPPDVSQAAPPAPVRDSGPAKLIKHDPPSAAAAAPTKKTSPPKDSHPPADVYPDFKLPDINLLKTPPEDMERGKPTESEIASAIALLETTFRNFEVDAKVTGYAPGPVITRYEISPAPGVKVSSIVALENDIALAMKAKGIRIIAPIPGRAAVGIEIPNARPALVVARDILESAAFPPGAPPLTFAIGLSADGEAITADLEKMPHLLVAGATGSGKSVLIHTLILSILFRMRPDEVKFLLIDPKRLELSLYGGIPHLYDTSQPADQVKVVTSPKAAAKSLANMVKLMEQRYEKFEKFGVRNIESYNAEAAKRGERREFYVVVVIDELADLMLVAKGNVEENIQRLAQMARAVGIHLVLATQRPSVDIITGVIKGNLPCRIALQVISKIDSRVILDHPGAESLLGKGDLLFLSTGEPKPSRCQGAYLSESEIIAVVSYLKTQGKPDYPPLETAKTGAAAELSSFGIEPLEFSQALKLILERKRVSQDLLKSQFGSSARATNILSCLETMELITKPQGSNRWEIHFDLIAGYLRQHFPQVPLPGEDRKGGL